MLVLEKILGSTIRYLDDCMDYCYALCSTSLSFVLAYSFNTRLQPRAAEAIPTLYAMDSEIQGKNRSITTHILVLSMKNSNKS